MTPPTIPRPPSRFAIRLAPGEGGRRPAVLAGRRRRWSVKVANLIASQYGFAISGKPPRHD